MQNIATDRSHWSYPQAFGQKKRDQRYWMVGWQTNIMIASTNISFDIEAPSMDPIDRIERRIKLRDVRVLLSVVQAGSMHKAAEHLGTSQPAISRAIADLEHALGVPLLDRNPRGIEPTQYGEAVIKRGLAVFDELRQSVKDIEFLSDPAVGELRIGCSEVMAAGPALAVIERVIRRRPRVQFQIITGSQPVLYRNLTARNVEFAVVRITEDLIDK